MRMGTSNNSAVGIDCGGLIEGAEINAPTTAWGDGVVRHPLTHITDWSYSLVRVAARHPLVMVVGLAAVLYISALGSVPLWDRDEPRNARCTAEMLDRKDWVVPFFNGELRTHKPVLLYWLMMIAYSIVGRNEWGARLASAVLSIASVCLTYRLGCRAWGPRVGTWGGVILATSLLFTMASRAATPDATLIFCTTLALTMLAEWLGMTCIDQPRPAERQSLVSWYLGMTSLGLGVLAKGPIGFLLPVAVGTVYLVAPQLFNSTSTRISERIRNSIRALPPWRLLLTGGFVVAVICLPWYVWVSIRTEGAWVRAFLGEHNWSRAMQSMEGHGGGIAYYPMTLMAGFFPWSVLTIPLCIDLWRCSRDERRGVGYLLSWVGVVVVGFSLAQTKLPSYILPAYPAVALLLAWHIDRWIRDASCVRQIWHDAGFATMATVGLAILISIPMSLPSFVPYSISMALVGLLPLVIGMLGLVLRRTPALRVAPVLLALSAIGINLAIFAGSTRVVGGVQRIQDLLSKLPPPGVVPRAAYGHIEPSWVHYGDQSIHEIAPGDLASVATFLESPAEGILFVAEPHWQSIQQQFGNCEVIGAIDEFLKPHRLLAIRRTPRIVTNPTR